MLKARAEVSNTADNPSAAAAVWTRLASSIPKTEANPARLPCSTLRVTTYKTDGPGMRSNPNAASRKRLSVGKVGMTISPCAQSGHYIPSQNSREVIQIARTTNSTERASNTLLRESSHDGVRLAAVRSAIQFLSAFS